MVKVMMKRQLFTYRSGKNTSFADEHQISSSSAGYVHDRHFDHILRSKAENNVEQQH